MIVIQCLIVWCFLNLNVQWIYAAGIYFPHPTVELSLPANLWQLAEPVLLLKAQAQVEVTPRPDHPTSISYQLEPPTLPSWLHLNSSTGDLYVLPLKRAVKMKNEKMDIIITAQMGQKRAQMNVELNFSNVDLDCNIFSQDICFWKNLKFQFFENQPKMDLGPVAPLFIKILCPQMLLTYSLINDSGSGVSVTQDVGGTWVLRSTGPQDREDVTGPLRSATLACDASKRVQRAESTVTIEVLDQDDNPPIPQKDKITVWISSYQVKQGDSPDTGDLIFMDRDSQETNNYSVNIYDYLGLLKSSCQEWTVDSRRQDTAVHCGITFLSNSTVPESPPYKATVILDNTSMLPGNASNLTAEVQLLFKRKARKYGNEIFGNETVDYSHSGVSYPLEDIIVARSSARYERLVQPVERVKHDAFIRFRLVDSPSAFNVTLRTGIVYVSDSQALHRTKWNKAKITIEWQDAIALKFKSDDKLQNVSRATLQVIIKEETASCIITKENRLCAELETKKDCVQTCGVSSSKFCQWRNQIEPLVFSLATQFNPYYGTCSPNLLTCPDAFCDELETLHPYICPQDCTDKVYGSGMLSNKDGARGIKIASGVCSCGTLGTCTCFTEKSFKSGGGDGKGNKNKQQTKKSVETTSSSTPPLPTPDLNVSRKSVPSSFSQCGDGCLFAVVVGSVLFLSGLVVLTFWLRRRHIHIGVRGKRKFTAQRPAIDGEDSREEGGGAPGGVEDGSQLEYLENKQLLSLAHLRPDPKWEFPRERLRIEQVLGEGEFGRVLRASAKDMPGVPGRLAVAVKTLKEGAGSAELSDLLSEYELLKEVSHPNVIRLLGASTIPGGPVYIIIEFAKHGSLRGFLRRSRRLEGMPPSSAEDQPLGEVTGEPPTTEDQVVPVTPRDLLSFAWQISKGMGYLSDIKLVHRDLAARNVLVASGGVCKVSDFGLTRDVYEDDAYLKRSKGRVPVKWMAIESLADHIYTSKSDVWSFGVLLWELVTLGSSPYPGIAVQNLFHLLRAGYRMERPDNCSHPLYRLMQVCWEADPLDRPSFKDIIVLLDGMLQDGTDYLELSPRVVHNQGYIGSNRNQQQQDSSLETEQEDSTGYGTLNNSNTAIFVSTYVPMNQHPNNVIAELEESELLTTTLPSNLSENNVIKSSSGSINNEKYESPLHLIPYEENTTVGIPLNYLEIATSDDYN